MNTDGSDSTWHHAVSMGKLVLRWRAHVMFFFSSPALLSRLTVSIRQQFFLDVRRELTWLNPCHPNLNVGSARDLGPTKKKKSAQHHATLRLGGEGGRAMSVELVGLGLQVLLNFYRQQ